MTSATDLDRLGGAVVLVPGAWMGSWIWAPVAELLRARGHQVFTPTLTGLEPGGSHADVSLRTHVDQIVTLLDQHQLDDVVLVGHSYSGLVVGQAADRRPDHVRHTVFVQAFLPQDGRSLIDDWGDDETARAAERLTILDRGSWEPPTAGLRDEPDLTDEQRRWLADQFVEHPARTVLDPATMGEPVEHLRATYIASLPRDDAPLPPDVDALRRQPSWQVRTIVAGHWPMTSAPGRLSELLHRTVVDQ